LFAPRHAATGDAELLLETYFACLKAGDTRGILSLLADPLLRERRRLLEKNETNSEFLKQVYESASMVIKNAGRVW
jgi:hypothetical protein